MLFETRDREYTAQILKRGTSTYDFEGTSRIGWRVCGNTTFIVHEPVKPPSVVDRFRVQMMYGAGLSRPKIPPLTF